MRRYRGRAHDGARDLGAVTVTVVDGRVASVDPDPDPPAEGDLILPGFTDLHCHGAAGGAFPTGDEAAVRRAARHHRDRGTTTLLASTVSAAEGPLLSQVALLADATAEGLVAGVHLEGPFLAAARCGAQDPAWVREGDPTLLRRLLRAGRGTVRQLTLAPETAHLDDLLDLCAEHDVIAGFGHTDADAARTAAAVAAAHARGVTVTATHLFNAMPPLHHRDPDPVAALLTAGVAGVELIGDGVHLADATVDLVLAASDRAYLVSDAMEAAGRPDGRYVLGSLDVTVTGGVARVPGGALAGGTTTLADQARRHLHRGLPPSEVAAVTSTRAAEVLARATGRPARGGLGVGDAAAFVVLRPDLTVRCTVDGDHEHTPVDPGRGEEG
ncbi:amidohydrolase family protein [Corynebacterium bovis]|uniref:N-acetylglucosamine-6-phosphate deacetylase n=1 Tax=Corynebacterium bovis TaxID=36808 RepID=UPI00313A174B